MSDRDWTKLKAQLTAAPIEATETRLAQKWIMEAIEEIDRLKGVLVEIRDEKNWIGSGWDMNPDNECPISYGQWVATEAIKGKPKRERCVDTGIDQRIRHDAPGRGDVCDCQKPKEG